jgi:arsenate reductase-like glutaredoxin family protein
VNAKKDTLKEKEALALARTVNEIYAAKGKQVVHLNMKKDKPDAATLKKLLLGPTGNLRAPTLRKGKTLVVGFDEETYRELFG